MKNIKINLKKIGAIVSILLVVVMSAAIINNKPNSLNNDSLLPTNEIKPNQYPDTIYPDIGEITDASLREGTVDSTSFRFIVTTIPEDPDPILNGNTLPFPTNPYRIRILGNINGGDTKETMWTSSHMYSEISSMFIADRLSPSTEYTNIELQLIGDKAAPIGEPFALEGGEDITTKNAVTGIESPTIVEGSETFDSFKITGNVTSTVKLLNDDSDVDVYNAEVFADGVTDVPLWKSGRIEKSGKQTFIIDKLDQATEYNNIKIQLISVADKKELGTLVDVSDGISTLDNIKGISNIIINMDSLTGKGFNFSMDVLTDKGGKHVDDYSVEAITIDETTNKETTIWTSSPISIAGEGIKLTVDGLSQKTEYKDINFKLLDSKGIEIPGSDFDTGIDVTTIANPKFPEWAIVLLIVISSLFIIGGIVVTVYFLIIKKKKNKDEPFDYGKLRKIW